MKNNVLTYVLVLLFGVFISSVSQVILKKAANKTYDKWYQEYLNVRVIFAYIIFFAATFCTIAAYKVVPLSMGPILEATSYIYIAVFGVTIFREKLNRHQLLALSMILGGIVVYNL